MRPYQLQDRLAFFNLPKEIEGRLPAPLRFPTSLPELSGES
jgi:hypothetical protein